MEDEQAVPSKRRRGIYLLPNLFTTGTLFGGFYAIIAGMNGEYSLAAIAIFIAMICDSLDGLIARKTNTASEFGKEYDSLCDMVAFGLAASAFSAARFWSQRAFFLGARSRLRREVRGSCGLPMVAAS